MNNILPLLYMLAFAFAGVLIARPVFKNDDPLRRVFYGLVFGLALVACFCGENKAKELARAIQMN